MAFQDEHDVCQRLAEDYYHAEEGARPVKTRVEDHITMKVADEWMQENLREGDTFIIKPDPLESTGILLELISSTK